MLAAYGAYMRPVVSEMPSSARAKLKELLSYRDQIGNEVTARRAQLQLYASADLKARASAALKDLMDERRAIKTLRYPPKDGPAATAPTPRLEILDQRYIASNCCCGER